MWGRLVEAKDSRHQLGAMELLGDLGFMMAACVILICLLWHTPSLQESDLFLEDLSLKAILVVGLIIGYFVLHRPLRWLMRHAFTPLVLFIAVILFLAVPVVMFLASFGIMLHAAFAALANALTGVASSWFIVSWLDMGGRVRVRRIALFTSVALLGSSLLSILITFISLRVQSLVCMVMVIITAIMLVFLGRRSTFEDPLVIKRNEYMRYGKEVEPLLFLMGIAFGMAFAYLYWRGLVLIVTGLSSVALGAALAITVALFVREWANDIILLMRFSCCFVVATCLVIPFAPQIIQGLCACVVVAIWSFFTALNYAILIRRFKDQGIIIFWNISAFLPAKSIGFLCGWLLTMIAIAGSVEGILIAMMLTLSFGFLLAIMVFWPTSDHHKRWSFPDQNLEQLPGNASDSRYCFSTDPSLNGYRERCMRIADCYNLSPREEEALYYLVRGRNAANMAKSLFISKSTARTHIYKVYRKLGIHSQQKIIDFFENVGDSAIRFNNSDDDDTRL
jgi:DNA-binding CsgD family transcriptional regulator